MFVDDLLFFSNKSAAKAKAYGKMTNSFCYAMGMEIKRAQPSPRFNLVPEGHKVIIKKKILYIDYKIESNLIHLNFHLKPYTYHITS
jgi:hypothetical protein